MRRRGGGAKRLYRIVDFKRTKMDMPATVERIEYDPNRTAFIALIKYEDGTQNYIIAPQRLAVGDTVLSAAKVDVKPGNCMPFQGMPIGTIVHNVELKPRNRHKGIRPSVRGVVMNPVDHPHGGGEGRTSGGRHPVTPWGKPTKGARTRSNKTTDKYIVRSRHAKKKGR